MKPLFPYYGSKWRAAREYLRPGGKVVEPFAGSAGYSLWHEPKEVLLIDADPIIVGIWQYLIATPVLELLALPDLEPGASVNDLKICQEARWLIGFWINRGSAQPKIRRTAWSSTTSKGQLVWGPKARERLTSVDKIRHWQVRQGSYMDAPMDNEATYFVDPPYVVTGARYRLHDVDHQKIGAWAQQLPGQVIVCERGKADWLPFEPLAYVHTTLGWTDEVVWQRGKP
jgi:site-specific DNA-adenine methylase